ncbi:hypothetical protein [Sphingobium phenoxybenzoativorans]|nr:hypothetical protein [Sphingobium phenoxybenzoativorans]
MRKLRHLLRVVAALMGLAALLITGSAFAQTRIENVATLSFGTTAGEKTVQSNRTVLDAIHTRYLTKLSFRRLPAGYQIDYPTLKCDKDPLRFTPNGVSADQLAGASPLKSLDIDNPLVIVLDNAGGNHDPAVRETSTVIGDSGVRQLQIMLTETGPDTGVFAGAVPPSGRRTGRNSECDITRDNKGSLSLYFAGDAFSQSSSTSLLIDPEGHVFDSRTAALIDGAIVTLIDEATGLPAARVFGDDGVSAYPNRVVTGSTVTDSGGWNYYFDKGTFRFPLAPPGHYRLKIEPPAGYTAPSVVKPEEIRQLQGPEGAFIIVDASYGGTFELKDPDPVKIDIPIDRPTGSEITLEKTVSVRQASPGDFVQYRLRMTNRSSDSIAYAPAINDTLPTGLRYKRGSTRGTAEPEVSSDGRTLRFTGLDLPAGEARDIRYVVDIAPGAPVGEALNRAVAISNGAASNEASASVRIKSLLFTDALTIIGRVTEGDCGDPLKDRKGIPGIRLIMEDGTFVITDRDGLYHVEGVRPGTHVVQIDQRSIPATHEAFACDSDTRQAGSALSRFVDAGGGSLNRVDFQLRRTGRAADPKLSALPINAASDADAAGNKPNWLADQTPGIDWLFPLADHNPRAPALRVVIKHLPGQRVALRLNGAIVDPLTFDGTDTDDTTGVSVSVWTGLPLGERDNVLDATVLDASGAVVQTLQRTVHYANQAVRATFVPEKSRLVADGLTRPLIAVRLTDRDGKPVRAGTMAPFSVDQPYTAAQEAELQQGRQLAGREKTSATARVVGDEGIAFISLEPTTQAGAAHVTVTLQDQGITQTSEFRPWLAASMQDWVIVGFGKGTVGYDMLKSRSSALPKGERNQVVTDGQLSFYAKGQVRGSWLLTIAYDSDKKYDPDRGLLGTIDPDRYYTVYGDGSRQMFDAATRRKLHLRLERREFYALFGDFETGLVDTKLTRYSRTLNGVKAEYQGERITFNGFAANSDQLYGRDEIQGNGLSGPYRLSGRAIVPNTDKIRIEVRDRFRSERIIDSKQLTRHIDYDIDADAGTIRFREPILSRDADLNPIFIVVDYETYGGRSRKFAAGGRVATRFADGKVEVGASLIRDETIGSATVGGIDIKARVTPNTEIRAEAASGGGGGIGEGRAWLAEVEHHGRVIDGTAYVRQQGETFGVGQQNGGETGTRKFGVDGRARLSDRISIAGSAWHQDNLEDAGSRTAGDVRAEYRRDKGLLYAGAQIASDTTLSGEKRESKLLMLGATQRFFGQKLEIKGETQFALGGADDSVDFPVRHTVGAAYEIRNGIRVLAEHEIAEGDKFKAHSTRFGFDVAPWTGAKLLSTLNQEAIGENGPRTFAQYGLSQSLPIGKSWTIDATLDASKTVKGRIPTGDIINPFHPAASGGSLGQEQINGDYQSATIGGTYRADRWSWNGRLEYRTGSESDRWGVTTNVLRTLGEGKTIAAGLRMYKVKDKDGAVASFASADIAIAYRPLDSRWSLLERFELRHDRADAGISNNNTLGVPSFADGDQTTTRAINNIAINYRSGDEGAGHGLEVSLYYGAKYVRGRYADDVYDGFIDVIGTEIRKDIGRHFDVGFSGSMQHAWKDGAKSFSFGPSAGVSPAQNVWITAGYNISGYRDRDFEADRYTRQGPYVTMRMKFDQLSLRAASRMVTGANR